MKQIYLRCLTVLLFSLITIAAYAQKKVTGTVTEDSGSPIPGVSVFEKGTNNGITTDGSGKFSLNVSNNAVLVVRYIGFLTKEVEVGTSTNLTIKLQADDKALEEVVITGLGETRDKRNLGYAMNQIGGEQIRAAKTINPISALQGLVPGLVVMPGQGGPQSTPKFQIRGASSLYSGENTPLIVIDGIMLSDDVVLPSRGGEQDFGNVLKNINPDDIESMSVLKGGSVTALYGSRASNGVILITTKKGYSQKGLGFSFSHDETFDKAYALPDMQKEYGSGFTPADFVKTSSGMNQINPASYGFSFGPKLDGSTVLDVDGERQIKNSVLNNPLSLYQTGRYINNNIAMQGGNEKTTFRFSYANNFSKGISPNNKLDRHTFNLRGTQRLADAIFVDGTVSYSNTRGFNPQRLSGDNSLIYGLTWGYPTNFDLDYWSKQYLDPINGGRSTNDPFGTNNLFFMLNEFSQIQSENNFRGALNAKVNFTKWLQLETNAALNWYNTNRENRELGTGVGFAGGYYGSEMRNFFDSRYRANLNLNHTVNDFDLFLQGGAELTRSQVKSASFNSRGGLRIPRQFRLSNSIQDPQVYEGAPNIAQIFATYGQGTVTYKQWLTLNLYARNEWNSTLVYSNGTGNYSYFYPGADAAFVFTDAFKMPEFFNFGKLRASYSITGGGTDVYRANAGYYVRSGNYLPVAGDGIEQYGFENSTLGELNLKPLRTFSKEIGFELKMLQKRLGIDFTVYKKNTKNQIIGLGTSIESGVSSQLINSGNTQDWGIELSLSGTPIKTKNGFSWDTYFNYTLNRTKIISLAPGVTTVQLSGGDGIRTIAQVGGEYSTMVAAYGYAKYQARDASGKPIDDPNNGKKVLTTAGSGGAVYVRASNYANGLKNESQIGSTLPKFYGSVRNIFSYKDFSLSTLIDAKFGGYVFSDTYYYGSQTGNLKNTLLGRTPQTGGTEYTDADGVKQVGVVLDGVFAQGTKINGVDVGGMTHQETIDKGMRIPTITWRYYNNSNGWSAGIRERGAFKSSWVAVRDITLGYDLPKSFAAKIKMNGIRVNVSARNVGFLYNNAPDNININDFTGTGAGDAFLGGGTPYVRTFGFGINGSF